MGDSARRFLLKFPADELAKHEKFLKEALERGKKPRLHALMLLAELPPAEFST